MRSAVLVLLALAATATATLAAPDAAAFPACGTPDVIVFGLVNGGVWYNTCIGADVSDPNVACVFSPVEHGPVHVYVLAGDGCTTGVVIS